MKKSKVNIVIILFFTFTFISNAQNLIYRVDISPLNRVIVYFSNVVPKYSSELTQDKKKIIIKLSNVSFVESVKETNSSGIIQNVYINKYGNDIELNISLKEKRGYANMILPYSNAIMVETFDWAKLSQDEDNFYSGLIAYSDGIYSAAKKHFKLIKSNYPNANALMGIIYLMEADLANAEENLLKAEKQKANINDVYAALSQLYKLKNNNDLSNLYKDLFIKNSNLKSFNYIKIGDVKSSEINTDSSLSLLDKSNLDTSVSHTNKINKDTISSIQSQSQIQDSTKIAKNDDVFLWLVDILKYIGIFFAFFITMLLFFYFKWRNSQLKMKEKIAEEIKKDEEYQKTLKKQVYKAKPSPYQTSTRNIDALQKKIQASQPVRVAQPPKPDESFKNIDEIKQLALEILQNKEADIEDNSEIEEENNRREILSSSNIDNDISNEEIEDDEIIIDEEIEDSKKHNSNIEFALHLQKEQQKIKEEKIKNIEKDISNSKDDFTELAKSSGLEKSALETKLNINNLQSDSNLLSKLSEKFNVKKKDS